MIAEISVTVLAVAFGLCSYIFGSRALAYQMGQSEMSEESYYVVLGVSFLCMETSLVLVAGAATIITDSKLIAAVSALLAVGAVFYLAARKPFNM